MKLDCHPIPIDIIMHNQVKHKDIFKIKDKEHEDIFKIKDKEH
jgi:hypothetical protein